MMTINLIVAPCAMSTSKAPDRKASRYRWSTLCAMAFIDHTSMAVRMPVLGSTVPFRPHAVNRIPNLTGLLCFALRGQRTAAAPRRPWVDPLQTPDRP